MTFKRRTFRKRLPGVPGGVEINPFAGSSQQQYFIFTNTASGGREYGAWITAGRATTIADSTVTQNGQIYNIVGIIESIIQDELIIRQGFSDLNVNTDSFDIAYDERTASTHPYSLSIYQQTNAFDLLRELAYQGACKLFFNFDKQLTIKAYDSTNRLDYYYMAEPTQLHESLNRGRIIDVPQLQPVLLNEIYSEIQVNYAYDYGRDRYLNNVYVTSSAENWDTVTPTTAQTNCTNAENNFHISKRYIYDARAIQSQETAERLCNYFADRLTRRLYICTFKTGLEGIQSEIGDFINIQSSVINGMWSSTYTTKKWEVFSIRFNAGDLTYEITAIEV